MIFISISVPQNPPVVEVVIHLMSIFKVLILLLFSWQKPLFELVVVS
jgi:hypothetical protein